MSVFGVFLVRISRIWTDYGDLQSRSPYSVRMRYNTDQKNSIYGYSSRSAFFRNWHLTDYFIFLLAIQKVLTSEADSELRKTSKMELFSENCWRLKAANYFHKRLHFRCLTCSKYASVDIKSSVTTTNIKNTKNVLNFSAYLLYLRPKRQQNADTVRETKSRCFLLMFLNIIRVHRCFEEII